MPYRHNDCGCGDDGYKRDYEIERPMIKGRPAAAISERDLPIKGKMSVSDSADYVIDVNTLSVEGFLKKYC